MSKAKLQVKNKRHLGQPKSHLGQSLLKSKLDSCGVVCMRVVGNGGEQTRLLKFNSLSKPRLAPSRHSVGPQTNNGISFYLVAYSLRNKQRRTEKLGRKIPPEFKIYILC